MCYIMEKGVQTVFLLLWLSLANLNTSILLSMSLEVSSKTVSDHGANRVGIEK